MAFCTNCGQKLSDGMHFCFNCGASVGSTESNSSTQRRTVYDGNVHKCIRCGEVINSFDIKCPACGYELRGTKTSSVVKELADKLERISSSSERCDLIRNFYIPNTKEDIFEFIILSASNTDCETKETSAWIAKMKQAYEKAKVAFKDSSDFEKIEKIYNRAISTYHKKRTAKGFSGIGKGLWSAIVAIGTFIKIVFVKFFDLLKHSSGFRSFCGIGLVVLFFYLFFLGPFSYFGLQEKKHDEHIAYLEVLVEEVEELIEEGDYDAARIKASQIVDDVNWSSESEEKWDDIREQLLDTIDKKEKASKKK